MRFSAQRKITWNRWKSARNFHCLVAVLLACCTTPDPPFGKVFDVENGRERQKSRTFASAKSLFCYASHVCSPFAKRDGVVLPCAEKPFANECKQVIILSYANLRNCFRESRLCARPFLKILGKSSAFERASFIVTFARVNDVCNNFMMCCVCNVKYINCVFVWCIRKKNNFLVMNYYSNYH